MAGSGDAPRVVRFGDFAFDSRSLELRKTHRIVRLQERPARALALLLSRPGEVVTRDELCKELWPAGTFVDFDNSLNNAISRLRGALGDDIDRPRFVATVGRRGYRFVAALVEEPTAAATLEEEQRSQTRNGDAASPEPLKDRSSTSAAPETRWGVPVGRVMPVAVTAAVGFGTLAAVLQVGWQRNSDKRAQQALRGDPSVAVAATGGADAGRGKARPTLTRAPEVVVVEVTTLTEKGLLEDAYRGVLRAGAELPASPALSFARAYVLTYAGYLDQASSALDEALAQDARYFARSEYTPNVLLYQGRWERFLALLPESDAPTVRFYRVLAAVERGRRSGLDRELGELFGRHPEHLFARLGLALDAALAGRPSHALTAHEALSRDRRAFYDLDGEVTFKQAQILGLAGLPEPGLTALKQAVAAGFVCADCFERSSLLAEVRKLPGYRAVVEHARQRHDAFGRMFSVSRVRSGDSP